jgi:hypothetical protein
MSPDVDPGAVRLPPEQIRFTDVHVEAWPDGRRVRVHASVTPFEQKPSLDFEAVDSRGVPVASATILETLSHRLVITLHLRPSDPSGRYHLRARLYYPEPRLLCDEQDIPFEAHANDNPQQTHESNL